MQCLRGKILLFVFCWLLVGGRWSLVVGLWSLVWGLFLILPTRPMSYVLRPTSWSLVCGRWSVFNTSNPSDVFSPTSHHSPLTSIYSIVKTKSSFITIVPGLSDIDFTFPSLFAVMLVSIFMASIINR